jgi:starch phosphorylase
MSSLNSDPNYFNVIKDALLNSDYFFVLKDFDAYVKAHELANESYKDQSGWLSKSIMNIAHSGYFTADRTIENYNQDIWHLTKIFSK